MCLPQVQNTAPPLTKIEQSTTAHPPLCEIISFTTHNFFYINWRDYAKHFGITSSVHQSFTGLFIFEPRHEISNNVVCATSKASDQPAHMPSLIRAFASGLNML